MKGQLRCAIYARVSTAQQDHALQLDELRMVAQQRGYAVAEFIDVASGSGKRLPERERLLDDARLGRIDVVLVWRFDRFARSTRDLLDALENFAKWNVAFISLRDSIDTATPTGRLVFTLVAAIAEFEKELIRERVCAGLAAAKRRGRRVGRPRCTVDLDRARGLLAAGVSVTEAARRCGVSPRTLRRELRGQNPPSNPTPQPAETTRTVAASSEEGKT